jgi:hypothetical protein
MSQSMKSVVSDNLTILLFGPTGSGKTAQIGELAEYLYATKKLRTRLYTADRGGWDTIKPYTTIEVAKGKTLIEPIPMFDNPFIWIDHAVKGDKWITSADGKLGKWVPGVDPDIGMYAYEGMTSMADTEMTWMADAGAEGVNIGGGGAFNFKVQNAAKTEQMKIGSNNMAHYGVAQQQVYDKSTQSMYLPGIVLWTAGDRRGEDDANGGVVGPQVAGKALTGEVPRWFKYTFRIGVEVMPGAPAKHILYTDRHVETQSKGLAQGISNSRVPLSGGTKVAIPSRIEPASLVQVMKLLEQRQLAAADEIKLRLGLA